MHLVSRRLATFLAVIGLATMGAWTLGCSGSGAAPDPVTEPTPPTSETATPVDTNLAAATAPVEAIEEPTVAPRPAQGGDFDFRDAQERILMGEEERRQAFNHYLSHGRSLMRDGRYEEAMIAFEEAVAMFPGNEEALRLLNEVQALLGRTGARAYTQMLDAIRSGTARRSEALAAIRRLYTEARAMIDAGNYRDGISKLMEARRIAELMSGQIDASGELTQINALIDQAQEAQADQRIRDLQETQEQVEHLRQVERENRIQRWREEIRTLYESARDQFEREQYQECLITLNQILWKDPYNDDVIRLREYARDLKYQKRNDELRQRMRVMWQTTLNEIAEARTPFVGELFEADLPPLERWWQIEMRADRVVEEQITEEDPEVRRIRNTLEQEMIPVHFGDMEIREVLRYLMDHSSVNFTLSREVDQMAEDGDFDPMPPVDFGTMKLINALEFIVETLRLDYYIDNGAVTLCTEDEVEDHGIITRIFNVKDLLGGYKSFPGEQIRLDQDETSWDTVDDFDTEGLSIFFDDLPDIIMYAVSPDKWASDYTRIDLGPNGTLIGSNTPQVLAEVAELLDDLRQSRGLMVSIECRFIEIQDNFLEEVGIDYRGAGGVPPGAVGPNLTAAPLDDFQYGLNQANLASNVTIIGRDTTTGIYWSNAPDSEIRSRVENMFDSALGDPDILTRSGGATFQFAILDDVQINAILRATKKRERVNLVTAPKITCFNTQRSNITVRNQLAYIEDFNVEAQQNVSIADPVVGTIEDGLVLDMRPVISADRRYITVEMQPTLALLQRPMDTLTTTLGGAGSTAVTIQLPELELQRIRTTVTVPDGGAFLLGGLREVNDTQQTSGVPIVSDIPILGNLFKRQGRSTLRSDLVIVIKARITDLREMVNMMAPAAELNPGALPMDASGE